MIRGTLEGDSLEGLADEILEDLEPRAIAAVNDGTEIIARKARELLGRKGPPITGAPPAYGSGELQGSIETVPAKKRGNSIRGSYGSKLPQAGRLEWGGKDRKGRYVSPHPYLRPAEELTRAEVEKRLDEI